MRVGEMFRRLESKGMGERENRTEPGVLNHSDE